MAKTNEKGTKITDTLLVECAWEVCNKVGGIYTVIRSKVPQIIKALGDENYVLLGPWFEQNAAKEFESIEDLNSPIGEVVQAMRNNGIDVKYGKWVVTGNPTVVLFNPYSVFNKLGEIKYKLWADHYIQIHDEPLTDQVLALAYCVTEFYRILCSQKKYTQKNIIGHFHEWMAGMPIMDLRRENLPVKTVFTTHATMLGRYLAMNDHNFYGNLPFYNWEDEAKHFNIYPIVALERAAAHGAHVMTTVSDITNEECKHLLGRNCDFILPNGLNIERFEALHEFQNLHLQYKKQINNFIRGHFFQSYPFDLDKTLYFFTSGRFEYQNKGFDLTLEALARLNYKMKQENIDATVVFFLISRQPYHSVNAQVLHSKALVEEIQRNTEEIERDLGRLFYKYVTTHEGKFELPDLREMVNPTMLAKIKRNYMSWKNPSLPTVVTHNLINDSTDPVLVKLRECNLVNNREDKVKIVYHPDFISVENPLFRMDYQQFVRGCHLGVFPSYYEPWGYTPLECMCNGLPSITSDLSGFGSYAQSHFDNCEEMGLYIVNRGSVGFMDSAEQLANQMLRFTKTQRRDRISMRNKIEEASTHFGWNNLAECYFAAYKSLIGE
ncbi:MAG: glycosyltransferase [Bacteroidales bacterium]|nr:glycosyltransferase [Bacteroidales bacterium]